MSIQNSDLEKHAAALGLTQEDAAPIQRVLPPVATADKVLLGIGCCGLAAASAVISVWMIVPTLLLSGIAAALLVRHLNAILSIPSLLGSTAEIPVDGRTWAMDHHKRQTKKRDDDWSTNTYLNPTFRWMEGNVFHDDHRHD